MQILNLVSFGQAHIAPGPASIATSATLRNCDWSNLRTPSFWIKRVGWCWFIWTHLNQVLWNRWNYAKVAKFHEFPTPLPSKDESKWQPNITRLRLTSGCEWWAKPWARTFASPEVCGLWQRSCLDRKHGSSPKRHVAGEAESES